MDWKRIRILVLDPDDQIRFHLRMILGRVQPARIMGTDAAGEALLMVSQYGPQAALVGVAGKGSPGIEFLRRLRAAANSPCPALPVVVMAGEDDDAPLGEACELGIEGVLRRPIAEAALLSTLEGTIRAPRRMGPDDLGLKGRGSSRPAVFFSAPSFALKNDDLDLLAQARRASSSKPPPPPVSPAARSRGVGGVPSGGCAPSVKPVGVEVAPAAPERPSPRQVGPQRVGQQQVGREAVPAIPSGDVSKPVRPKAMDVDTSSAPPRRREGRGVDLPSAGPPVPRKGTPAADGASPDPEALRRADIARRLEVHREWVLSRGVSGQKGVFAGENLEEWPLKEALLSQAELREARLGDADLEGAFLGGADLRFADLSGARLDGADLSVARLRHAGLRLASLTGANLRGADLSGADLSGARLGDADLTGAVLLEACLDDADLGAVVGLVRSQLRAVSGNAGTRLPIGMWLPEKT
ncbi:MAG: pentapeptide repeat-containing protein [Alphaproteobacteria bacterium]|nr:pentapeptide repeat-containing protein [Alphaproteobacteria bacterium]